METGKQYIPKLVDQRESTVSKAKEVKLLSGLLLECWIFLSLHDHATL